MARRHSISVLRAHAEIALWKHGWVLAAAPVAALLAIGLHIGCVAPTRAALEATRAEAARESRAASTLARQAPPLAEKEQLSRLQGVLRGPSSATELVKRMAALAQAEQIALQQSDYQQQFHPATQVTQMQINQPVKASYVQLRRYVEAVLREMPNASLDQISARRENVGQAQLEVRLRWSFWIQAPAPAEGRTGT